MSASATRKRSRGPGVRAKKSLGQHFLKDAALIERIAEAAEPGPGEVVIEVGPGTGVLTRALVQKFGLVIAVEIDTVLASLLQTELAEHLNLRIVRGDVRNFPPADLLRDYGSGFVSKSEGYKVVGNLPYYVASPIIRHFLESDRRPQKMVVTVQQEVGDNMVAARGKMSLLSLAVQVYGHPEIVARIPASKFHPRPKVDSAVVAIDVHPEPLISHPDRFFRLARAGFRAPRKQLHNSLAQGLHVGGDVVHDALEQVRIDGRRRPATLSIQEWDRLSEVL